MQPAGEEQVFPVHDGGPGSVVMVAGEFGECLVEFLGAAGIIGDALVDGDGRAVAGLEVVTEVCGLGEQVNPYRAAPGRDAGDPVAEQLPDVLFATPQRRRLCPGRRRGRIGLHGGEHLADKAVRGPADQADGSARTADPDQLVGGGLMMRGEHDSQAGHDHVELAVAERERLGVGLPPFQRQALLLRLPLTGGQEFGSEVAGDYAIPLFFLIGLWGGPQRRRASITFFLYTLAGSLLTLLGVIALVVVHYQFSPGNVLTFSIPELTSGLSALNWADWQTANSWTSPQVVIFLLLLAGFAIKVPMFPFHTWLPLAHVEAPTAGSILLAGVLLKVGSYGLLRFNLGMTPLAADWLFPLLATLAVIGIIYGALTALAQTDIKRLVAYSSVSHMGFIVLGLFALNPTGMDGSVIQMLNHGLTTGALFACVGVIYERYHTR